MTEPKKENKTKKTTTPKKSTNTNKKKQTLKVSQSEQITFPYEQFPVKIIHKDGKDMSDTKTCYFQSEHYAQKYIVRCKFKKTDYQMFVKPQKKLK